ncbi:MAG: universal stress protein [Nitrosopumilus sp.]|nr:universal stress protein [Nitrosopumilus sp.]NRA05537.1 universal stress protein [Nitrosopumilus sp.]
MNKITIGILSMIVLSTPIAFADSERNEKLEFAGTLEETLGHFWALEMNLDENNAELALVHATHPISELYETMSEHLESNPDFAQKLQSTLLGLKDKVSTDVNREQTQLAINDAKKIIQEAREIVIGHKLSDESEFKMQLINQLLETSKVEYKEAIVNGIIEEIAEFQDGSAFIWQSQQIFNTIEGVDPIDSERINNYYEKVWADFDIQADPTDVTNSIDAVIYEFEELSGIQSVTSEHEEVYLASLAPLKQLKEGVEPKDVQCKSSMKLIFKHSGDPACVKSTSVQKLVSYGWAQ